ncbi:MAG: ABC transporter permease [Betaproteobacteria bacterium]
MDVVRRNSLSGGTARIVLGVWSPLVSVAAALLVGAVFIRMMGISPWAAYRSLFQGTLGSLHGISETLLKTGPVLLTGLSFALAFRSGLFNVGAEGQLYLGALGSILVAVYIKGLPLLLHLPLAVAAGFAGGGLWGLLAGWLKVRFGANEIITTVMLNYVAINLIGFLVNGPLQEPTKMFPETAQAAVTAQLPRILPGTRLHLGFLLALLAVVFYYAYLWRTQRGFELRVIGLNPRAGRYAGMDPQAGVLRAMFLAGGLAGLAGTGEALGVHFKLMGGISPGYGFDGLAVALLGNGTPLGIVLAALLFGLLRTGGNMMQMFSRVPVALIYVIQALVILFAVAQANLKPRR